MEYVIVILLIFILILLFEINGKLPKNDRNKDAVERALQRDRERRKNEKDREV